MIEKYSEFYPGDAGYDFKIIDTHAPLEKTASAQFSPEILKAVEALQDDPNFVYALVNALGAGEYFSSNRNGDYFPEESLKKFHPTFVQKGYLYQHHVNKDPRKKLGDILASHYNDKMKRVELIVGFDRRIPDAVKFIKKIEDGNYVATSMGSRVKWDECSICGNKAKTRAQYCDHLKYKMNQILPTGERVYAVNPEPEFFDISVVIIPADRTSGVMVPFIDKLLKKEAAMIKRDSINTSPDKNNLVFATTEKLPKEVYELAKTEKLAELLSTMLALRILPKPEEFQKLAFYSLGKVDEADELEKLGHVFKISDKVEIPNDVSLQNASEKVAKVLLPHTPDISLLTPFITARVLEKTAEVVNKYPLSQTEDKQPIWKDFLFGQDAQPITTPTKNPTIPMATLGALYAGYIKLFGDANTSNFVKFLKESPWLTVPLVAGALGATSAIAQELDFGHLAVPPSTEKTASAVEALGSFLVATPISYYYAGKAEADARQGIPISTFKNFVRENPMLTSLLATGAGAYALKKFPSFRKNIEQELDFLKTSSYIPNKALNLIQTLITNIQS